VERSVDSDSSQVEGVLEKQAMETIVALVAVGASFGVSFLIGRSLAASTLLVVLGGLVSGLAFAVAYFVSTVTVGNLLAGTFDAWSLGVHFVVLLLAAPLGSALVAALAHRHAERTDASRLPF
jgi:hypothetical protein